MKTMAKENQVFAIVHALAILINVFKRLRRPNKVSQKWDYLWTAPLDLTQIGIGVVVKHFKSGIIWAEAAKSILLIGNERLLY